MHDPHQAPARAELLLATDVGPKARGRPIHDRLESEDGDNEARAEPDESAGDLARIDGVTPRTCPRSANSSPRPETTANARGRAYRQRATSRTPEPDTHGNRPMTR